MRSSQLPAQSARPAHQRAKKPTNPKEKLSRDNVPELSRDNVSELLGIPKDKAKELLSREKQLGKTPLVQAEASHVYLVKMLLTSGATSSPSPAATLLVLKQPKLLLVSEEELASRFSELQSITRASPAVAAGMVVSQPGLLTHAPQTLQGRLANLTSVFNVEVALAQVGKGHLPCIGACMHACERGGGVEPRQRPHRWAGRGTHHTHTHTCNSA